MKFTRDTEKITNDDDDERKTRRKKEGDEQETRSEGQFVGNLHPFSIMIPVSVAWRKAARHVRRSAVFRGSAFTVHQLRPCSSAVLSHGVPMPPPRLKQPTGTSINSQCRQGLSTSAVAVDTSPDRASNVLDYTLVRRKGMRCLAIVAHVDHGKTSLVDKLLQAAQSTDDDYSKSVDRLLDSGDLERERGITITSKVTRLQYRPSGLDESSPSTIINIADSEFLCVVLFSLLFPEQSQKPDIIFFIQHQATPTSLPRWIDI